MYSWLVNKGRRVPVFDTYRRGEVNRGRGLTKIMPRPTGTHRTVEMRAILAVCQAWSCVLLKCCFGAFPLKLPPKKRASAFQAQTL